MTGRHSRLPHDYGTQGAEAADRSGYIPDWNNYTPPQQGLLPSPDKVRPNVIHAGWENSAWKNSDKLSPLEINPYASGKQGRKTSSVLLDKLIEQSRTKSSKMPNEISSRIEQKEAAKPVEDFDWQHFADEYHAGESHIYDSEGNQILESLQKKKSS